MRRVYLVWFVSCSALRQIGGVFGVIISCGQFVPHLSMSNTANAFRASLLAVW